MLARDCGILFRPFRAFAFFASGTQGVALGCHVSAFQATDLSRQRRMTRKPRATPWDSKPKNIKALKGRHNRPNYFINVHPFLPILHKKAFLKLYRLYDLKALTDNFRISDGSTLDDRAVDLICVALALGSLSLVEIRKKMKEDDTSEFTQQPPHFEEVLEFYEHCLRLLAYTHDTLETMIMYFLMVLQSGFEHLLMKK